MSLLDRLLSKSLPPRNNRPLEPYDPDQVRAAELEKFARIALPYDNALRKLDQTLAELGKPAFSISGGIASIHWLLFSAISLVAPVREILEIGTFEGETTQLLARLFPDATVTTVDLPDDDPIFLNSRGRNDPARLQEFKNLQRQHLEEARIRYLDVNSFFLPERVRDQRFDLTWIDGGHLYPEVAWDLCNAYHLAAPGAWIMCDDVITARDGIRTKYISPESHEALEYMSKRTGEPVTYFLKRWDAASSADSRRRKYVALFRKAGG